MKTARLSVLATTLVASIASAQQPSWLRDRGPGQPTSMFGTYIQKGQLLLYPFAEYYYDRNYEYKPEELGYLLDRDFRGKFTGAEGLIFAAYGITDWLAIELEAAVITAKLEKSSSDPSPIPSPLKASGVGDIEGQLRMRLARETSGRPEIFSYLEAVSPRNRYKPLIATPAWEYKLGSGISKGTSIGTFTMRAAVEYNTTDAVIEPGEFALEYVRRVSDRLLVYTGIEGVQDEIAWIGELQVRLTDRAVLKLNNAIGVTSKATDWAPEVGLMFTLPRRR